MTTVSEYHSLGLILSSSRQLQLKEIKRDARDLRGEEGDGEGDKSEQMKRVSGTPIISPSNGIIIQLKLLRRFFELVSAPSMEEKEECVVCLTEMSLQTARRSFLVSYSLA